MRYRKLTGIILRKQNYREADQIATIFSREAGKVRILARGIRLAKSKLSGSFQDLTLISFEATGRDMLPTLISSKTVKPFLKIKHDLSKTAAAFYAAELMVKLTADEQANVVAFDHLIQFLTALESRDLSENQLFATIDSYSLKLLSSLGFSIRHVRSDWQLPQNLKDLLTQIEKDDFLDDQDLISGKSDIRKLHKAVNEFVEYIIERHLNSQKFLTSIK
ncbi:MAG: DNA repair protein RecO [Acidobacteriaceae bacterium]